MYNDIKLTGEDKKKIVSELLPIYKKVKKKTHIEEYHNITLDNGLVVDGWIRNASGWGLEEDDGKVWCAIYETQEEEEGFLVTLSDYHQIWEFDINEERKQYV